MDTTRFRVRPGRDVNLRRFEPGDTHPFNNKRQVEGMLEKDVSRLVALQEHLYAQDRWAVLLIFQAMDAAGKDSAIKHVMSGLNPQGTQVSSFKRPSEEELDHDYLWRTTRALPERGRIGIFNRSYYEEVLVVRVHPEILARQKTPASLVSRRIWAERYEDINAFERYLSRNGTLIRKFFLHVSKDEQRRRFLARLENPHKHWKWSDGDLEERARWDDYLDAYEAALTATSTEWAPWYVVPADGKPELRALVAGVLVHELSSLDLTYPSVSDEQRTRIEHARRLLEQEG
jgi:PPK2 family polyphosphate:nucleotide phosphotransferase